MKFIHTADLHFDSRVNGLIAEKSKIVKEGVFKAFESLLAFAKENGVKAIIIAGDMFDTATVSAKTKARLVNYLVANQDIDFLYLAGNHDDEVKLFTDFELPCNFKIFSSDWTYFNYENITIAGIRLDKVNKHMVYNSLALEQHRINIVAMHGQISAYDAKDGAEVISLAKLKNKNIDYLALGHIHSYSKGQLDDRGEYAYSGCIKGRGFDELGDKGFVLIETDGAKVKHEFIPLDFGGFYEHVYDVTDKLNFYSFMEEIVKEISKIYTLKDVVKLTFIGERDGDFEIDKSYVKNALEDFVLFVKVYDNSNIKLDLEKLALDKSIKGEFIRLVSQSNYDAQTKNEIISLGLKAIKGEDL